VDVSFFLNRCQHVSVKYVDKSRRSCQSRCLSGFFQQLRLLLGDRSSFLLRHLSHQFDKFSPDSANTMFPVRQTFPPTLLRRRATFPQRFRQCRKGFEFRTIE